jgi:NTP pyrophosphatase (non-canonical NTP hydrolase)
MGYGCQREFHLNDFHRVNAERAKEGVFGPEHDLKALGLCASEEIGEVCAVILGMTGEKKRKAHLTREDLLSEVADAITYLSLIASKVGCADLETVLGERFNTVSKRAGSKLTVGV